MTHGTLTRILQDLRTLDPDELRKAKSMVDKRLTPTTTKDPDDDILEAMLHAGLISEIKRPDSAPKRERPLVPIIGKPLSETIVQDRR